MPRRADRGGSDRVTGVVWPRLLKNVSSVDANLPYNWNWQRKGPQAADFLSRHPIQLMDIGARGDPPPELASLRPHVCRVGFEPDPDECRRLNQTADGTYFPAIVGGTNGKQELRVYREPSYSSVLSLSRRFQRLWSGDVPLDQAHEVDAVTVDEFLSAHPAMAPDLLKLDTQGSELAILEGAQRRLASIGLVEVEVEFFPIYDDQPLAGDVMRFMSEQGFELLYLNRVFLSRSQVYRGPSRGQVVFGDALFGKREDRLEAFTEEQLVKYAILLCHYGHLDIAWQLFQQFPELDRRVPELRSVFRRRPRAPLQAALMQVDKLLALALHLRRHNQRTVDSDRSWPIR
jgi:FkbM family methyltransferase